MNHGIVLLICFIVPEIHLGCGDDSQRLHPKPNLGNYIILRNVVQEDFIDLNSINPDVLMKLESNILNEEKKIRNESAYGLLNPSKNHSQAISMPQEESNLAKPSTRPKNYLAGNQNPLYENVDDSIHQVKYHQKDKELEATNTKYTKKYSEKIKNVQLITKNVEPIQGNNLIDGKEKELSEPQQNKAEKRIIYKENKENIVLNKKFLTLQKSSENGNPYFKPKLKELSENDKGKIDETKGLQKKLDYRINPSTIESNKGQMLKPDKTSSMNKDRNEYHNGPLEFGKNSGPMNQTKITNSGQINPKSYLDFDNNLLQPGNFLIAKVTSKKGDIAPNDQILLNKSRNSFDPTRKPFENTLTTSTKAKANNMHQVLNSTKTFPVDNVLPNYEEKVSEGFLLSDYNSALKKTGKEGDINDLIQVDVYGAFFNKPTNNETLRQKKNIDGKETDKLITPWKTVDMVLAGFVLLTVFVLGTICLALRMKKKRRKKKRREFFTDSEENGFSSPSNGPEALKSKSSPKPYANPERVNLARYPTTNNWQLSESNETGGRTSDYSDEVTWSEATEPNSPPKSVRYHKHASRKKPTHPETAKNVGTRSVSSMSLPSLPTVCSSSTAPTSEDVETPPYSFRNIPGYIPSVLLPSLPTVSSGSSNYE